MIKENTVLTIDVGGASLKMAEFSIGGMGDSIVLERYAIKEFPEELTETGFADAFASAFREMMMENQFVSHQVRVAISSLHSFQRLSKLPPLMGNRAKAMQVVETEAKQAVPYPLNEVVWDYQLIQHTKFFELKGEGNSADSAEKAMDSVEELEALFVAIKDDLVTKICSTLLDAGMEVLSVEVSPTSLYNAARANNFGEKGCDLIIDMGGRGSNLLIVDGSRVFMRSIPIGGNTITQQIAKEFSISFSDAEEMKRKHGYVALGGAYEDSDSEVASTISKIARNVMTRLHGEVNRSINAWHSMYDGNRPSAIFITGGTSIIPYVPHFLNEKLALDVSFLNTFPVTGIGDGVDKDRLLEVAHLFPPLVGLGIRHIRTCPVEISLIPRIVRSHRELQRRKPFFYMSALCALLCLLVFYGGVTARTNYDRRLENAAKSELEKVKKLADEIKSLNSTLNGIKDDYKALSDIADSRTAWLELLNELQKITPKTMWFTEIDGLGDYSGDPDSAMNASASAAFDPMDPMGLMTNGPMGGMGMGAPRGGMGAQGAAGGAVGGPAGVDPANAGNMGQPGGMGMGMGMGMGAAGMDPMALMTNDPMSMGLGMEDVVEEVKWLRLKGHSLVLVQEDTSKGIEDVFREALSKSDFFDHEASSFKMPVLTVNAGTNNVTNFVIYVKLKNPIKQK